MNTELFKRFSFNTTHHVMYRHCSRKASGLKDKDWTVEDRISLTAAAAAALHLGRSSSGWARNAISSRRVSAAVLRMSARRAAPLTRFAGNCAAE